MAGDGEWKRRSVLRGAAVVAGAVAAVPLLGAGAVAKGSSGDDADALFKAGKFEQAGKAYEEILKADPTNLNATRQRGYVGLLSNRFPEAEKYLKMAVGLAPTDKNANTLLGDCYIRQDKFALSVPCWKALGNEAYAEWFGALGSDAYQINGDSAQLPFQAMDPEPLVEVSLNGGSPKRFTFYTGAPWLSMTATAAKDAGLTAVYKQKSDFEGQAIWQSYGVLDSFKLGDMEVRNVPVAWSELESGGDVPPVTSDGMIGTWFLYHLQPTFDYAGRSLILRRPTAATTKKARADAKRAGADALPLWLAFDHMVHSTGSIDGSGKRVMAVNLGGNGEITAALPQDTVDKWGIRTDKDRPLETAAHSHAVVAYPCYPKEIRLGDATAKETYCNVTPDMALLQPWGFDVWAHLSHCYYKPYNVTLDFTGMNLYIASGKAA